MASLYIILVSLGLGVMPGIRPRNASDTSTALDMVSPVLWFRGVALLHQGYVVIQYGGCLRITFFQEAQYAMEHLYLML